MFKFIFLFVITFLFSFSTKQEDEDVISWNEKRPLTWDDFKGAPEERFAVASTSYEILRSVAKTSSSSASVKIQAIFFCKSSWKKGKWISEEVLMHEQKHFDIVEIYARKFRRLVQSKKYTSGRELRRDIDSLYTVIDKELDVYQDRYDDETESSMNGKKQREWDSKVQKELKSLNDYSPSSFSVTYK
jgi:hypothetical protein